MKFLVKNVGWLWLPITIGVFAVISVAIQSWVPIVSMIIFFAFVLLLAVVATNISKKVNHKVIVVNNYLSKSDEEIIRDIALDKDDNIVVH